VSKAQVHLKSNTEKKTRYSTSKQLAFERRTTIFEADPMSKEHLQKVISHALSICSKLQDSTSIGLSEKTKHQEVRSSKRSKTNPDGIFGSNKQSDIGGSSCTTWTADPGILVGLTECQRFELRNGERMSICSGNSKSK